MDFNALLEPAVNFSSEGIGAVLVKIAEFFYQLIFPANAEAATAPPEAVEPVTQQAAQQAAQQATQQGTA